MTLLLRSLLSIVILPGTVTILVPSRIVGAVVAPSGLAWLGLLPLAFGLALFSWSVWDFARRGRGTLAPWDAPRALVATGPYRVVRNPMYVAVVSILLGEAVLLAAPAILVWLAVFLVTAHTFVVVWEEPSLERTFGESYRAYRARVWRWLPTRPGAQ
jgi:protein-S-isoprenylcysteine O-methyltransferase Ste14